MRRAIAFLVRDENWGTFTPSIEDLKIKEREDFRLTCADASIVVYTKIIGRRERHHLERLTSAANKV